MKERFQDQFWSDIRWHGKIVAEKNITIGFKDLIDKNIDWYKITWFDIHIFQWKILSWKLHLKKEKWKRTIYKEFKDNIPLQELFYKFQNVEIKVNIWYQI